MYSTHVIIDFNGFPSKDSFQIKEYALLEFNPFTLETSSPIHHVSGGKNDDSQNNEPPEGYRTYFEEYGIQWHENTQSFDLASNKLSTYSRIAGVIFLRNKAQEKRFKKYVDFRDDHESVIICLDDLGFLFDPKDSTSCKYHQRPHRNNCAKDNLKIMFNWLVESKLYLRSHRDKMNMVVDFSIHYMPYRRYTIKELTCYELDLYGNYRPPEEGRENPIWKLVKPPVVTDPDLKEFYDLSYRKYIYYNGTDDTKANCEFNVAQKTIKKLFLDATFVYVKDYNKEMLLTGYIKDLFACNCNLKIIRLDEFGYDLKPKFPIICGNHEKIRKIYCAKANAAAMVKWLRSQKMYLAENRNKYFNNLYKFVQKKKVRNYKYETEDDRIEESRLRREESDEIESDTDDEKIEIGDGILMEA